MPELLKESDYWSPSKTESIVGTKHVAGIAQETLVSVAARMLQSVNHEETGTMLGRVKAIEDEIKRFVFMANADRLAAFEKELVEVCEAGRDAKAALPRAKSNELQVRQEDAHRTNTHNAAVRKLTNARNAALPNFYTNADVEAKLERIADAQQELDTVVAEMGNHPNAIPNAVHAVREAERTLNTLIARERELRRAIAALRGESVEPTMGNNSHNNNGLQN